MNSIIELTDYYSSNNYAPLKLVISKGKGAKFGILMANNI